ENRFKKVVLSEDITDPSDMEILPGGNVIITEVKGNLKLYRPAEKTTTKINHIPVSNAPESGLLAIVADPHFQNNHWLYLMYSPAAVNRNYLSRFTWTGDSIDLSTEKVILQIPDERACCHVGGGLAFDTSGNLYMTIGDNTNPFGTNYAPIDDRGDRKNYNAQRTSANTKDLRGKVLRIHPEKDGTYTIPPGNLFRDTAQGRPEIFAMGCRNPYKVTVDKVTNIVYWGEVGPDASDNDEKGPRGYDEINQGKRSGNYGWPYFVGNSEPYAQVDFSSNTVGKKNDPQAPVNSSQFNTGLQNLPPVQAPLIWYPYDKSDLFPQLGSGGRTAIAGPFYYYQPRNNSTIAFPEYFDHAFFIADWMRNWIKVVRLTKEDKLERIEDFMPLSAFQKPISLEFGADGALYVLEFGSLWGGNNDSRLVRVEYTSGNRPPVARITTDKAAGALPLKVQFSAAQSYDYDEGDNLSYQWMFDGKVIQQGKENAAYTFTRAGSYRVKLTVRDKAGKWDTASLVIKAGNSTPDIQIQLANKGMFYKDTIHYRVAVTDKEDGSTQKRTLDPGRVQVQMQYYEQGKVGLGTGGEITSPYEKGNTWINESDCKACHAITAKSVGPSFTAIASKYSSSKNDIAALNRLVMKVINGGYGTWGEANMSAHPQLSKETVLEMVRYILSLADQKPVPKKMPLQGTIITTLDKKQNHGTYVLSASYTDKGGQAVGPLTGTATKVLRSPLFTADDFDEVYELRKSDILSSINKQAYAKLKGIDMTGVNEMIFKVATETTGTSVEVHLDSPTGPLVARTDVPVGKWKQWQEIKTDVTPTEGEKDVYLVFKNRLFVLSLLNLESVYFNQKN
ncbi:MAG TPA: PQQ-dependent sugar dehydrogenase, partial [Chitinophagaceae bacterium]|nr:PQQ-dependent sugar dehydrogenase [Chitinophagaceae bacterium]